MRMTRITQDNEIQSFAKMAAQHFADNRDCYTYTDGDIEALVDIGDLTALISYLYIPPNPEPAACP